MNKKKINKNMVIDGSLPPPTHPASQEQSEEIEAESPPIIKRKRRTKKSCMEDKKVNENTNNTLTGILFFTPLEGQISQSFERKSGHLGLDIVGAKNDPIKSTLDGTIIFADWTTDGGHEIHIQHSNNIVSVYKHNSYLLKKTGDRVRAGDPVAIMGNTGSQTDGAHLHFEIWVNGKPVDPQNYLAL